MGTYVHNPGKCPQYFGQNTVIPGNNYGVLSEEIADTLRTSSIPVQCEGSPGFEPLWIQNIPDRTPDQIP
jgi:hypothetical protein